MTTTSSLPGSAPGTAPATPPAASPRQLLVFATTALVVGGTLLGLSTIVRPDAPFIIAAVLFGLALPAFVLTYRESGAAGVRALLRDCVRLPRRRWWLAAAALGLPALTWTLGAALGGAQPLTWGLVAAYAVDVATGALIINLWEEMAWTGFFQRRAVSRWGVIGGSLVTAVFFTGIHLPLTVGAAHTAGELATGLAYLVGAAVGLRLLIGRVDAWSGRSLLVVGVLHSAFNATEAVLQPEFFWVRIVVTIALGVGVIAFARPRSRTAATPGGPTAA